MGMSSSQARLLSLTGRMHDIEYKAQNLEAQKLQMANESTAVYKEYENALNASVIQHKIVGADGKANFIDTTYNNFIGTPAGNGAVYGIRDAHTGALYVPDDIKRAYNCSNRTVESYLTALNDMKSGANAGYISITSADQLKNLNGATGKYRLDSDITVSNWSGISDFRGTFDGNGHTITITSGTQGLFATATGATIKNVNVSANINTTNGNVGALVGNLSGGTVENCYASGSVNAGGNIGGLIGITSGAKSYIKYSGANVDVTSNFYFPNGVSTSQWGHEVGTGGLVGYLTGHTAINNCISKGDVTGEYAYVGGFIGLTSNGTMDITVSNSESYGNVVGNANGRLDEVTYNGNKVGGGNICSFIGDLNGTATNCNSYGTVSKNGNLGVLYQFLSTVAATATVDGCYSATAESESQMGSTGVTITGTKTTPNVIGQNTDATKYPNISDKLDYYIQMFSMLESAGENINSISVPDGMGDSSEWFTNIINNGEAVICQITKSEDGSFSIYDVNVATDTNLQEVQDETDLKKAEAKYEADMRKINAKDKKFDTDLAALESERNAIKTEMDTLKTVIKDNVDMTFKLFT